MSDHESHKGDYLLNLVLKENVLTSLSGLFGERHTR